MHIFQKLKTLISHIYFKTIVIDNLNLFRKWRGSSPVLPTNALRGMIKDSINRNFVLEIQVFIFFLAIITLLFDINLLILIF